jgi:hypothetical protein
VTGRNHPLGRKYIDDVGKADAAFAAQHAGGFVETENAVETAAVDQFAVGVETRVAVTAAQAIREAASRAQRISRIPATDRSTQACGR